MSFRTLELPTVTLDAIEQHADCLKLKFHGEITKMMDGAKQRTLWKQSGTLIIHAAEIVSPPLPKTPVQLTGGEVTDNIYVYRNILRLPLHSHGDVGFRLELKDTTPDLAVRGNEIKVILNDDSKYIRHLD